MALPVNQPVDRSRRVRQGTAQCRRHDADRADRGAVKGRIVRTYAVRRHDRGLRRAAIAVANRRWLHIGSLSRSAGAAGRRRHGVPPRAFVKAGEVISWCWRPT